MGRISLRYLHGELVRILGREEDAGMEGELPWKAGQTASLSVSGAVAYRYPVSLLHQQTERGISQLGASVRLTLQRTS